MSETQFERPSSAAKACELLAANPLSAVVLAGGTDLAVKLRAFPTSQR